MHKGKDFHCIKGIGNIACIKVKGTTYVEVQLAHSVLVPTEVPNMLIPHTSLPPDGLVLFIASSLV